MAILTALAHVNLASALVSIGAYTYVAIFVLTLLSGHLIPLPEEIVLLAVGYSAGIGIVDFWFALPAAILGLLTGDLALYAIGHHGGRMVERLEHRLPKKYIDRYSKRLNSRPVATIVGMRFISGVRIFSPIFAAAWKIPFRVFILADFGALCAYVFLFIGLGYVFNTTLDNLIHGVSALRHLIFVGILLVLAAYLAYHAHRVFFSNGDRGTSSS